MAGPTREFWQERFAAGNMPWDRGAPSPHLQRWIDDGSLRAGQEVIVPGCGQGWEVLELARAGLQVTGIDFAPDGLALCRRMLEREAAQAELVEADVLAWMPRAEADAVVEQACLCALHPDHWAQYAAQLHRWLKPGGRLLAFFMQLPPADPPQGFVSGPPYHCDINGMRALFPATHWEWPKPPYPALTPKPGAIELAVVLVRK